MSKPETIIRNLPIWHGPLRIQPLHGGTTNVNMLVQDDLRRAVVRLGDDIAVHQILRFNEVNASRAAHAAGISPAVIYHAPGVLVIDYIVGRTLVGADFQDEILLDQAISLIARTHRDVPKHLRGAVLTFWVFHVIREYIATLCEQGSPYAPLFPSLLVQAEKLQAAVGPIDLVFGHNDLLPGNFIVDDARMWLIDWDYAGFNSALFDLGGLAANAGLSHAQESRVLAQYFGQNPDTNLWRQYRAMKAAAALREALWSMVSEVFSEIGFDYVAYTDTQLTIYRTAFDAFLQS